MHQNERREYFRVSVRIEGHCLLQDMKNDRPIHAEIMDVSPKGMRLKFTDNVVIPNFVCEGNHLLILESSVDEMDLKLAGRRVSIIWQDGGEVGCLFHDLSVNGDA